MLPPENQTSYGCGQITGPEALDAWYRAQFERQWGAQMRVSVGSSRTPIAHTSPKPHIRQIEWEASGQCVTWRWACSGSMFHGLGSTPAAAYADWKRRRSYYRLDLVRRANGVA